MPMSNAHPHASSNCWLRTLLGQPVKPIVSLSALAMLLVLPTTARTNEGVFEFDASKLSWSHTPPTKVRGTRRVTLTVTNPNVFRDAYKLELIGISYHTATLPSALEGIIRTVSPETSAISLVPTPTRQSAPPADRLPKALRDSYDRARDDIARVSGPIEEFLDLRDLSGADYDLVLVMRTAQTNRDARKSALKRLAAVSKRLGQEVPEFTTAAAAESQLHQAALARGRVPLVLETFEAAVLSILANKRFFDNANIAAAWDSAAKRWEHSVKVPTKAQRAAIAEATDWIVSRTSALSADFKAADEITPSLRTSLEHVTAIVAFCLDASFAGDVLERQADPINEDRVVAAVEVSSRPWPLRSEDAKKFDPVLNETLPSRRFETSARVYSRWNVDFSAGLAFTRFRNKAYYTEPIADTANAPKVLKAGGEDRHELAPAALGHYLFDVTSVVSLGGSLGITTTDPVRFLTGGTIQFGNRRRLAFSFGAATGKHDVLVGQSVGSIIGTEPRTRSAWDTKAFFAASFAIVL